MAIVELESVPTPIVNRSGYEMRLRTDLLTITCVICMTTYDGAAIDVNPVDTVCVPCGQAIARIVSGTGPVPEAAPRRYEDIFPDDGVPALHDNDPVEAKPKRVRKPAAKKVAKK